MVRSKTISSLEAVFLFLLPFDESTEDNFFEWLLLLFLSSIGSLERPFNNTASKNWRCFIWRVLICLPSMTILPNAPAIYANCVSFIHHDCSIGMQEDGTHGRWIPHPSVQEPAHAKLSHVIIAAARQHDIGMLRFD